MSILLPSPHITSCIFDKSSASIMNIFWGFIFALLGSVPIILNRGEEEKSSFYLLSILVPLGLYAIVWGFVSFGFRAVNNEDIPTYDKVLLLLKNSLFFPFVFLLSPLVALVVSFRAIFRHNDVFWRVLTEYKFIECFIETSTQLCLQLYILMKDYPHPPTVLQTLSVTSATLCVAIPAMEKYLQHKPYTFKNYFKFYPIFTFNTVFRILTWSIIFYLFYFFYGVVTLLCYMGFLAFTNLFLVKVRFPKMVEDEDAWNDYKSQLGEMAVQSFLAIPNLQDTPAARFCRKFSFYASLFFNLSILLIIVILCNLGVHLEFDCRPVFGTGQSSDCKHNTADIDIKNFNTYCLVVMSIGVFSLMLDMILKDSAVFNAPESSSHLSNPDKTSKNSNGNQL